MKEFLSQTFSIAFICGIMFFIASVIMYFYPPKKLNAWIGYRTAASLRSQERWDFAQKFSAMVRIKTSLIMIAVSLTGFFFPEGDMFRTFGSVAIIILWERSMVVVTDKELKKRFTN
jgi:uncharacterized membrane protein